MKTIVRGLVRCVKIFFEREICSPSGDWQVTRYTLVDAFPAMRRRCNGLLSTFCDSDARKDMHCPLCKSGKVVDGKVIEDGSESGFASKFLPDGLRFFTLNKSVRLSNNHGFTACTECGHVWNELDPPALRELIASKGKDSLRERIFSDASAKDSIQEHDAS